MTRGASTAPHPLGRRAFGVASLVASLLIVAGCATVPGPAPVVGGDTFSGRLAIRVDASGTEAARSLSAAFDLRGAADAGTLGLSTPLGSMLAQAQWSPAEVVLVTPQGTRRFASLEALTRDVLGESVPIEAWFDWLHGRPWPGAPSAASTSAPTASPMSASSFAGFAQLGWAVDLTRFGDGAVTATREAPAPTVTVRIRLDRS